MGISVWSWGRYTTRIAHDHELASNLMPRIGHNTEELCPASRARIGFYKSQYWSFRIFGGIVAFMGLIGLLAVCT